MGESVPASSSGGTVDDVLSHFGVRGMQWGVRRSRKQIDDAPEHTEAKAIKKKASFGRTRRLSNQELQTAITRMNLEQQFRALKTKDSGEASKLINDILKEQGKVAVREVVKKHGPTIAKFALKTALRK